MDAEELVEALKHVVRDAAISDTLANLQRPPGRTPPKQLLEAAEWYRALGEHHRRYLAHTIASAVDKAIFGLLCVVDGVRAVEEGEIKGRFELWYKNQDAVLLNAQGGVMLHDLYNAS